MPDHRTPLATLLSSLNDRGDFYRCLIETTLVGVWVIDSSSRTTYVNERMAAMLGYSTAEMEGAPLFSFMDEEGRRIAENNVKRRAAGIHEHHEFVFRHNNGTPMWTLLATNPLYDASAQYAGALAMVTDISAQKAAEEALRRSHDELERRVQERTRELDAVNQRLATLAMTDSLTGLLNRRAFDARLREETSRAVRHGAPLSLMLLDIDHFKLTNDRYGHEAGDCLLSAAVQHLAGTPRETDISARYGGDEFAIIAPHTPLLGALVLAERIRARVASYRHHIDGKEQPVTVSIGVAELDREQPAGLVVQADRAMYEAKRAGRNCVRSLA